jgi:hypothetical protein
MPKIDPTTGCVVMTDGEFWVAEARREGRQPHVRARRVDRHGRTGEAMRPTSGLSAFRM